MCNAELKGLVFVKALHVRFLKKVRVNMFLEFSARICLNAVTNDTVSVVVTYSLPRNETCDLRNARFIAAT